MMSHVMSGFKKHPDVAQAAQVGEPTLVDTKPMSAKGVVAAATNAMLGKAGNDTVSVEIPKEGAAAPQANEAVPHSDSANAAAAQSPAEATDPNELKPNVAADPSEAKADSSSSGGQPVPPPAQMNEMQNGTAAPPSESSSSSSSNSAQTSASTSKPKKKKGLHKIIPF
jgi:hypothetical protein